MANMMTGEARPYEQKRSNFPKMVNLLTARILLTQMMIRWWDQLNGFRTIRS